MFQKHWNRMWAYLSNLHQITRQNAVATSSSSQRPTSCSSSLDLDSQQSTTSTTVSTVSTASTADYGTALSKGIDPVIVDVFGWVEQANFFQVICGSWLLAVLTAWIMKANNQLPPSCRLHQRPTNRTALWKGIDPVTVDVFGCVKQAWKFVQKTKQ